MKSYTRRKFLAASAATAGAVAFASKSHGVLASTAGAEAAPAVAVTPAIQVFNYNQVELFEGTMRQQFDTNHDSFFVLTRTVSSSHSASSPA